MHGLRAWQQTLGLWHHDIIVQELRVGQEPASSESFSAECGESFLVIEFGNHQGFDTELLAAGVSRPEGGAHSWDSGLRLTRLHL